MPRQRDKERVVGVARAPTTSAAMPKPKKQTVAKTESGVFNLLSRGATFTTAVRQGLAVSAARLKNTPGIMYGALASNTKLLIPIPDFSLAYTLNCKGFQGGRMMSIIGADGIGKTSLLHTIGGWAMRVNSPYAHLETEGKPMPADRIIRCLHPDKRIAEQMFNAVSFLQSFEIVDAVNQLEQWLMMIRNKNSPESYVPDHIPALIALDTYSKLMAAAEAVGYHMYAEPVDDKKTDKSKEAAKTKNKKKQQVVQELGAGSNMGHASMAHKWSRRLPSLLTKYNAFLIIARHQNEKVEMQAAQGGGSFIPKDVQDQWNRTSIGGKAFAQSAIHELVMTRDGKFDVAQVQGDRIKTGMPVKISLAKNSLGPPRDCHYVVNLLARDDTETYQEPAVDFSVSLPNILKRTGLLQVAIKNASEVSCKELGVDSVTPRELNESLNKHPEIFDDLCMRLGLVASGPSFKAPPINSIVVSPESSESAETPENAEQPE